MTTSLPILLILAALVLLTGVLVMAAILLAAKRCRMSQKQLQSDENQDMNGVNPWEEAGKRIKNDFDEPS